MTFFCWSCGVKLGCCASNAGESGPCPECGVVVTAPGEKQVVRKIPAIQYLREEGQEPEGQLSPEKQALQVEVYVENETSRNILPGLLPKRVGDVILPPFTVIRGRPRWVTTTLAVIALSPLLWLAAFYFPEVKGTVMSFETFRQKQLLFVEGLLRSSAEAQAVLDKKARIASSRPDKPQARAARQAVAAQTNSQPPKPEETASRAPPPPQQNNAHPPSDSLASHAPEKPAESAPSAAPPSAAKNVSAAPPPPAYSSPYNPPPPEPYRPTGVSSSSTPEAGGREDWPQMVLHNNGIFAGHTPARGGCGFLVEDDKGSLWLATTSKLLGFEGGVVPPVNPEKMASELYLWRAHFPDDPNAFVDAVGGSGLVRVADAGWLALKITPPQGELPALPLKLRHNPPAAGELVYLVGLPADDHTGASQHMYAGRVTSAQQQDPNVFGVTLEEPFKLNGFAGAPIVDLRGQVLGVLTGGRTSLLIATKADRLEAMLKGK